MAIIAIPTLAGLAAISAALDMVSPVPITLSTLVVGDGDGNPVTPVQTMTGLVNQRAAVPLTEVIHENNQLTIKGVLDETIGGFIIRECGILDDNGQLLFVASTPETQKLTSDETTQDILTLGLIVVLSQAASVVLNIEGETWASHDYVNNAVANHRTTVATPLRPYHIAVISLALTAPPSTPAIGDTYIPAAGASGDWAGQVGKLAQYTPGGWIFVTCPNGHMIGDEATGHLWQRRAGAWSPCLPRNGTADKKLWLQDFNGTRTWTDPRDLSSLTAVALATTIQLPTFNPATGGIGKTSVGDLVQSIALSDYLHSELYFLGMM